VGYKHISPPPPPPNSDSPAPLCISKGKIWRLKFALIEEFDEPETTAFSLHWSHF
jgi:hypothetical protein